MIPPPPQPAPRRPPSGPAGSGTCLPACPPARGRGGRCHATLKGAAATRGGSGERLPEHRGGGGSALSSPAIGYPPCRLDGARPLPAADWYERMAAADGQPLFPLVGGYIPAADWLRRCRGDVKGGRNARTLPLSPQARGGGSGPGPWPWPSLAPCDPELPPRGEPPAGVSAPRPCPETGRL